MKRLFLGLALISGFAFSQQAPTRASKITAGQTATGVGEVFHPWGTYRSFQALSQTTASTGSLVVNIEVSNDCVNYVVVGTISLSLTTTTKTDGFVTNANWACVRSNVTTLTGTGASVDVWLGN